VKSFFAELKRRKVHRVAIAYAIASWLLFKSQRKFFRSSKFQIGRCA